MNHSFGRRLAVMAALTTVSSMAAADFVASPPAAIAPTSIGFDAQPGTTVLGVLTLPASSASDSVGSGSGSKQSAALGQTVLLTINNNFDLTLWNFITTVRAQQANQPIPLVQASVNNIALTLDDAVSEVPLPAGAWLFLSGLLGVAGMHLRRRSASRQGLAAGAGPVGPMPSVA